jgi:hypothetical protein
MTKYKWALLAATFVFLGLACYRTFNAREKTGPWSMGILCGTAALSVGLVAYALLSK